MHNDNEPKVITIMLNIPDEKTGDDRWCGDAQIAVTDELKAAFSPVVKCLPDDEKIELQVYRELIGKLSKFTDETLLDFGEKNKYRQPVVPIGDCYIIHPEVWQEMNAKLSLLANLKEKR